MKNIKQLKLFSIYKITNIINDKCYIGQTEQKPKARQNKHIRDARPGKSNLSIHNAIRKHKWGNFIFVVIATATDKKMANLLEKFYIRVYESNNRKFGYNLTDGGSGTCGYKHTDKDKLKISDTHIRRPVRQYSSKRVFVREYASILEAELITGIKRSNIGACCRKTCNYNSAGGFLWCFKAEEDKLIIPEKHQIRCPVSQYSSKGVIIREYTSAHVAQLATGVDRSSIGKCCQNKAKTAGGFIWKYSI